MSHKKECVEENDNNLILNNANIFKVLRERKGHKLSNWNRHIDLIIVPVTINICINSIKYKIDFIKYSKYIIDILNDGFSGKLYSPYKNIHKDTNFKYNQEYIKKILEKQKDINSNKNSQIIYNYINAKIDTKIRFYLHSIVYHDIFIEEKFVNNDTEKFLDTVRKLGFRILSSHRKNLNINIIKFNCSTLGISIFPWMKYVSNNISSCMQVFLDFCTIHPDIANNNFNNCRTVIHEVGHIFGLRHSFSCNIETVKVYSILLGKLTTHKEMLDKINLTNSEDIKKTQHSKENSSDKEIVKEPIDYNDLLFLKDKLLNNKDEIQLYSDIPMQTNSTNYDPFELNKFPFCNNIPSNFACFMDYSPDMVLTHFTESQKKIMHYMIRLFKPYLIKKSKSELNNMNNNKVKLYINKKNNIKNTMLNTLLEDSTTQKYYVLYDNKHVFRYSITDIDEKLRTFIYKEK
jgi:hypothetical protein